MKRAKIINYISTIIIVILLITFLFNVKKYIFAETTITVDLKTKLSFNADLDRSKRVDGRDLALLMFFFGKSEKEYKIGNSRVYPDINGDKIVDGEDLVILASHFGFEK